MPRRTPANAISSAGFRSTSRATSAVGRSGSANTDANWPSRGDAGDLADAVGPKINAAATIDKCKMGFIAKSLSYVGRCCTGFPGATSGWFLPLNAANFNRRRELFPDAPRDKKLTAKHSGRKSLSRHNCKILVPRTDGLRRPDWLGWMARRPIHPFDIEPLLRCGVTEHCIVGP